MSDLLLDDPLALVVFLFALLFGSFLNVVIHRLPRKEGLVFGGSRCPACSHAIRWYENVPVLSWLLLRGRCSSCRARISLRYPLVELATAVVVLLVYLRYGATLSFFLYAPFAMAMVALFAIDLEHQLLPNAITIPGTAAGLLVSPFNPEVGWTDALLGAALGYGLLWLLAFAYERLRGVAGLGGGDLKLAAMIGAFGGSHALVGTLLAASLAGVVLGLTLIALRRASMQTALPFGCFLAPAALAVILLGADVLWNGWQALVLRHLYGIGP